ncbi:hypothetical protein M6B38_376145 [Iris pallida]|uniref:Maturase K n=1 Tax=Iris pallida TaxID=29817 RepID=A0AAX6GB17_IRIPA|nr:hypothetical protein M6B38_181970 [Iris pallida]KAJ6825438.1 hypothetical protein M6B38_376145 [Iris pallida]
MLYYYHATKARQVLLRILYHIYGPESDSRMELCFRIDLEFQSYS